MSKTDSITKAKELPCGARFFRCALQVNPFDYIVRHSKETVFNNESDYNAAIVEACQKIGIEVIGVADHYRVRSSQSLIHAAQDAGIEFKRDYATIIAVAVRFRKRFTRKTPNSPCGSIRRSPARRRIETWLDTK